MLKEIVKYKVQSPSNKLTLLTQEDTKTNYSTFNSPISFKDTEKIQRTIQTQNQTLTISNQTISQNNLTQRYLTTFNNTRDTRHMKTLSSPNIVLLESLIDDLSINVISKFTHSKKLNTNKKKELESNVNQLSIRITQMKIELDTTQFTLNSLINKHESMKFEHERLQKEAFHNNVERDFLNQKIKTVSIRDY